MNNLRLNETGLGHLLGKISTSVKTELDKKVNIEEGKALSTNDFSDAYKAQLDGLDAALAGKSDEGHGHVIADVDGLEAAIADAKAAGTGAQTYAEGVAADLATETGRATAAEEANAAAAAAAQAAAEAAQGTANANAGNITTLTGTVEGIDGRLTTAEGEIDTLQATIVGLQGAMHYRGSVEADPTETAPTLDPAAAAGDVVIFGSQEYVFDGTNWKLFGDEGSYLTKTEAVATYATIETVNGVAGDLSGHKADAVAHITAEERTNWNGEIGAKAAAEAAQGTANANAGAIEALQGAVATKAETSVVEGIDGRLTTAEGEIDALQEEIAKKALASDLETLDGRVDTAEADIDALEGRMTTAEGDITTLEGAVATKAESSVVEGIDGRLATAEGNITTLQGAVATKAETSVVEGIDGRLTTAEGKVTALETGKADKATTLAGYGITDAYTTTEMDGKLSGKANVSHTHELTEVNGVTATVAEINHLSGVTSNIQTQLNAKAASDHIHEAYVNQNAFSNVQVGDVTVTADSATDTLVLAGGANVTVSTEEGTNNIVISAVDTVYTHATHTAAAEGLYKVTVDGEGHVSATTAVTKADITALGIPAQDTTYAAMTNEEIDAIFTANFVL